MNDSSSEQRPVVSPLLETKNIDTLKELWFREKTIECPFLEYRLKRLPESLKAFVDLFLKENGRCYDYNRLIWSSKKSFVRVGYGWRHDFPGAYRNHGFKVRLERDSRHLALFIHSSTREDAMSCLDLLVGLHDDHFREMTFYDTSISVEYDRRRLCPLTSVLLEKIVLQNAKRNNSFSDMTFTPDQSRTLATSGTRTDIELDRCKFIDDGEAFMEALAARLDPQTGLAKLRIWNGLPFAEGTLILLLDKLECLTLSDIHLETEESCGAVAAAGLHYLELDNCKLDDGGAALVDSVREGRGPKGLGLSPSGADDDESEDDEDDWRPFVSSERFNSFLNALRCNSHLERLLLSDFDFSKEGTLDALAAAVSENKGLVDLGFQNCHLDEISFSELMRALSTHSSLLTLDLTGIKLNMNGTKATKAVAEMLSVNTQLEGIRIEDDVRTLSFDAWSALVTPRLACNVYRKRFPAIQEIRPLSTRAAVMASTLAHVSNKPSPAFMLLRENVDILSSYLVDE
jgi:hypothetical protein